MLTITIPAIEQYDEEKNEFIASKEQILQLEHSLVSLSKWESKWRKPFLTTDNKTIDESIDYIRCMTLTQNVDNTVYNNITPENIREVSTYIEDPMTATTFSNERHTLNREVFTAEIIYYWMITLNIPIECQKWHLNRLLTLINVCNIKSQSPKKMGRSTIMSRNSSLNAARRELLNTKG